MQIQAANAKEGNTGEVAVHGFVGSLLCAVGLIVEGAEQLVPQ